MNKTFKSDLDLADEIVKEHNNTIKQVTEWLKSLDKDIDALFAVYSKVHSILHTSDYYEWDFIMDMTEHRHRYEVIPITHLICDMLENSEVEPLDEKEDRLSVLLTKEQQEQSIKMMTSGFGKITVDW